MNEEKEKKERKLRLRFLPIFFKGLIENKLYLLTFLVTIAFFVFGSFTKVKDSEGFYTFKFNKEIISDIVSDISEEKAEFKDVEQFYYEDKAVMMSKNNLIITDGKDVLFNLKDDYPNSGGHMEKRVYKTDDTYKFIVFSNGEDKNCFDELEEDGLNYTIYSISYNKDTKKFDSVKEIVSRNKSEGCNLYLSDIEELEK